MPRHKEDIIESNIGPSWLNLNVRALFRRMQKKPDEIGKVLDRFLKVFKDHGVHKAEIPRLFREVTLAHLDDHEKLVSILTPQLLKKVSEFFGIQQEWLEGTTNRMYPYRYSYKYPEYFFEDFKKIKARPQLFPVIVFFDGKELNRYALFDQRILFVFREIIAEFGERTIYKYVVQDAFTWNYWKSRIQAKAMMQVLYYDYKVLLIPYYKIGKKDFVELEEGRATPAIFDPHHIGREKISLENYALPPKESKIAQEVDELPEVAEYINDFQLSLQAKKNQTKDLAAGRAKFH